MEDKAGKNRLYRAVLQTASTVIDALLPGSKETRSGDGAIWTGVEEGKRIQRRSLTHHVPLGMRTTPGSVALHFQDRLNTSTRVGHALTGA